MKLALEVVNSLERDGIIGRYALGGAMAAVFYAEPVSTFDVDIFIAFSASPSGLISLAPIYEALARKGFVESGDYVEIGGVPVQFLATYNTLVEESLEKAVDILYDGVITRVFGLEYLIAIAMQTGRPKDRGRVEMLLSQAKPDMALLEEIVQRYGLKGIWKKWTS